MFKVLPTRCLVPKPSLTLNSQPGSMKDLERKRSFELLLRKQELGVEVFRASGLELMGLVQHVS